LFSVREPVPEEEGLRPCRIGASPSLICQGASSRRRRNHQGKKIQDGKTKNFGM